MLLNYLCLGEGFPPCSPSVHMYAFFLLLFVVVVDDLIGGDVGQSFSRHFDPNNFCTLDKDGKIFWIAEWKTELARTELTRNWASNSTKSRHSACDWPWPRSRWSRRRSDKELQSGWFCRRKRIPEPESRERKRNESWIPVFGSRLLGDSKMISHSFSIHNDNAL